MTDGPADPAVSGLTLRDFVQHKPNCGSHVGTNWPNAQTGMGGVAPSYPCTCGLDQLLAASSTPGERISEVTVGLNGQGHVIGVWQDDAKAQENTAYRVRCRVIPAVEAVRIRTEERQEQEDVARVESQPLSGSAALPQRSTEAVPPTAPETK